MSGILIGSRPIGIRGAYKRSTDSFTHRKPIDPYVYLEAQSGEYNEQEKKMIDDPYVDGWEWYTSGKRLKAYMPSRWLRPKSKSEHMRLFKLGFKDAGELT